MMQEYIEERTRKSAEYIAETGCTVRACANRLGVSKSTVHTEVIKPNGFHGTLQGRLIKIEIQGGTERL